MKDEICKTLTVSTSKLQIFKLSHLFKWVYTLISTWPFVQQSNFIQIVTVLNQIMKQISWFKDANEEKKKIKHNIKYNGDFNRFQHGDIKNLLKPKISFLFIFGNYVCEFCKRFLVCMNCLLKCKTSQWWRNWTWNLHNRNALNYNNTELGIVGTWSYAILWWNSFYFFNMVNLQLFIFGFFNFFSGKGYQLKSRLNAHKM